LLFRQFFLTIPDELAEAAKLDGAGPLRFFIWIAIPLSRTNIAALFVILFIYGWNLRISPAPRRKSLFLAPVGMGSELGHEACADKVCCPGPFNQAIMSAPPSQWILARTPGSRCAK
jgi:binding-protein-dependent transport system inner membrane component